MLALSSSNDFFFQLINELTHTKIQTKSTSCIDPIFTDKQGLSVDSGVHPSLHPNCHHQTIYSTFNLNLQPHPTSTTTTTTTTTTTKSLNQRLVWDYKKADPNNIRKALDLVNWEMLFDQKSIEAEIATFNDTMLNIFRNFVPNKWINETIKSKIKAKLIL